MRSRMISVERLEALATRALAEGGRLATWRDNGRPRRLVTWDLSMQCSDVIGVELNARYSANHSKVVKPMTVILVVRCRKCEWCRKMRSRFWTGRAMAEYGHAQRNVFGTLTARPEDHFRYDTQARVRLGKRGVDFDGLHEREKFEARCVEMGGEVTLWLKRLREGRDGQPKPKFRYLLIAEAHDSENTQSVMRMRPHFHVLLHEYSVPLILPHEVKVIKKDDRIIHSLEDNSFVRRNWYAGFTKFEIATDPKSAAYLCKYLNKSLAVRVRASQRYGSGFIQNNNASSACSSSSKNEKGEIDPPSLGTGKG